MKDQEISIRISKSEFDLISKIKDIDKNIFNSKQINVNEYKLSFADIEKAIEFDELIKDKLIYQGFDHNYNINEFGKMCENVIDKMHEILRRD